MAVQQSQADNIGMARQYAGNMVRLGWYSGLNWLAERRNAATGVPEQKVHRKRPVPSRSELMADLRSLLRQDAELVRDGIAVADAVEPAAGLIDHIARLRAMFADLGNAAERRHSRTSNTVSELAAVADMPDYFAQDFHFQKGGYLSEESARLYDVQVETLFYGAASAMRRTALRPIAEHLAGKDQRQVSLLDVACGTGRLLREIRLAFPALRLTGLDLSSSYLSEAAAHMNGLRSAQLIAANAEQIPLPTSSQDIVTTVFLFHELPGDVRRRVASEMARVLKPGGRLVFIDSLQMGDKPNWDGLLEAFPQRYHEPYYRQYAIDDLVGIFSQSGLRVESTLLAFLAKVMVWRKS
ncbi:MAG: class I SAM-dependent methyltransferase [Hyphomicrobiaceae bacterium]|nr:class I SAM-dependent methyltransferase [Hyphomicrobiaceae bacterium]